MPQPETSTPLTETEQPSSGAVASSPVYHHGNSGKFLLDLVIRSCAGLPKLQRKLQQSEDTHDGRDRHSERLSSHIDCMAASDDPEIQASAASGIR